jgi:thioredoxin reductase (NADPH)
MAAVYLARPVALRAQAGEIILQTAAGDVHFDVLYPMLGNHPAIAMLESLRPKLGASGALLTDAHQETSIPGIYAAGDVVEALDQIAVAVGQAAIATAAMSRRLVPRWA